LSNCASTATLHVQQRAMPSVKFGDTFPVALLAFRGVPKL
jgi:hypothetical protein